MPRNLLERKELQRRPLTYLPFGSTLPEDFAQLSDRFRRLFGESFVGPEFVTPLGWAPAIDIVEGANELTVKAELPGVNKNDVRVTFADGMLTIQGEKKEEKREKDETNQYHVYERSYGTFTRSFTLPNNIDEKHITAEFKDGVLTVHMPKGAEVKKNGKTIEITG
jgi:HSP20 family protein